MKTLKSFLVLIALIALSGCQPRITKENAFPDMYADHPKSILVLPPINSTTAADAKEYYSTTIAEPLTASGYYVYPLEVVFDILQREGMYDTETISNVAPEKFREFFGTDAVMYVKILKWDTSYYVLGGNVTVAVESEIKSAISGKRLWYYNGTVVVNTTGDDGGMTGWAGLLAKAVTTAIKSATTDYVPLAKKANEEVLQSLPFGAYHPSYQKDQNIIIIDKKETPKSK
ncbi:MAG: DUF799 family lipoprotein [Ignavibacteria bacterium]|jgi:hypothetical protein|nr:DUF799 family lipoprotein [Ignavibacteria bacterium]MCU7502081.1 DUF799 family lipoprotein [Ignavibacteria bacterium]MCU7515483.1 DUF799 family lipoprotein [Ignavibacteria bacterium]